MAIFQKSAAATVSIDYGHNPAYDKAGPMTVVGWVSSGFTFDTNQQILFAKTDGPFAGNGEFWVAYASDGVGSGTNIEFVAPAWSSSPGWWAGDAPTLFDSKWHHWGVTYNYTSASDVPHLFWDGHDQGVMTNVGSTPSGSVGSSAAHLRVGNSGQLDQAIQAFGEAHVAKWNCVLSSVEMQLLAAGADPRTIRPQNLVFYSPLDNPTDPAQGIAQLGAPTIAANTWGVAAGPAMLAAQDPAIDHAIANVGPTPVSKTLTAEWNVGDLPTPVSKTLTAEWNVVARVSATSTEKWNVQVTVPPGGAVVQLIAPKDELSFTLLSKVSEHTALANLLARTLENFDGVATDGTGTFASNTAVASGIPVGVGDGSVAAGQYAFSAACSCDDGYTFRFGGGHDGSGDGSFLGFDPEVAAAIINGGGDGGVWQLLRASARYIDAFDHTPADASYTVTAASPAPTALHQDYYPVTNKDGQVMPLVGHSYYGIQAAPGTRRLALSNGFRYSLNGQPAICAPFAYDVDADELIGPISVTDSTGGLDPNGLYGFAQRDQSLEGPAPIAFGADGTLYAIIGQTFGWGLLKYSDFFNSSVTADAAPNTTDTIFQQALDPGTQRAGLVIPDPSGNGDEMMFVHGQTGTGDNDAHFVVMTGLKNITTPGTHFQTYSGTAVTTDGVANCCPTWDPVRGVIWMTDGAHTYKITPSATLTAWTIELVTTTGDTPPTATSSNPPSLKYVPANDALIHVFQAQVRVLKPDGWSPPTPPTTSISTTGTLEWDLLNTINASRTLEWALRNAVSETETFRWNLQQLANRSADLRWNLRQLAARASDLRWDLRQFVSHSETLEWDLLNLGQVSRTFSLLWNLRQQVAQTQTAQWAVLNGVARPVDLRWNLQQLAARNLDARWDMAGKVIAPSTLLWNVRNTIIKPGTLEWNVFNQAIQSRTLKWDMTGRLTRQLTAEWGLGGRISSNVQMKWNVLQRLILMRTLAWSINDHVDLDLLPAILINVPFDGFDIVVPFDDWEI
jgi:hypothetical protein